MEKRPQKGAMDDEEMERPLMSGRRVSEGVAEELRKFKDALTRKRSAPRNAQEVGDPKKSNRGNSKPRGGRKAQEDAKKGRKRRTLSEGADNSAGKGRAKR